MIKLPGKSKWLVVAAIFALCVAPTFISYQPYRFNADDSDYLYRSIAVSRAFWSGNVHGIGVAMISIRPPVMTLMGLPWGSLPTWQAAGNCFITLAAAIALLVALCLYLLLRIGVKPFFLVVASLCVFASIGPFPAGAPAHGDATAFMADSLFAWTALAAVLLIPYEARTHCQSMRSAVLRGVLWASILSLGAMTKLNFLYFVVLIVPTLILIRLRHEGLRSTFASLTAFGCCSAPSAFYLLHWGRLAFVNAKASSFGGLAGFYYQPLLRFLGGTVRESPGMAISFALMAGALIYLAIEKRANLWRPDVLALLFMIGFAIIVLAAPNKEIRFSFPVIVALPFVTAILMSGKEQPVASRTAALAAGLVFCGLLAAGVPTRHRPDRESIARPDAVLAQAAACHAKSILLATDGPTLNPDLMDVAIVVSGSGAPVGVDQVDSLTYDAVYGTPIIESFQKIDKADEVVFQDRGNLGGKWTNQRVPEYERYVLQRDYHPVRVGGDVTVYTVRCRP